MADSTAQSALQRALQDRDLLLLYQPIHDATTRTVYSAEALVRQRRQSGEIREASIITDAAEDGPDLFAFDSWAVRTAYRDAAQWQSGTAADVRLNVNLSPREFQEGNVLPRLRHLLSDCRLDPHTINLEITESSYIEHPTETMNVLEELTRLGINLWLDDFGTGHSSITHLQHFPVEGIKIPQSFVEGIPNEPRCRAITRALIGLAHDLGMKVIAEGVEREEQLATLLEWRCDYIQGFLFSRPMTLAGFERFLAR